MPSLPVLSGKAVCSILASHGFENVRQSGGHVIMQLKLQGTTITDLMPNHKELRTGTLRSIIRQSGLSIEEFTK